MKGKKAQKSKKPVAGVINWLLFFLGYLGLQTALWEILRILCENLWRNKLLKLTTLNPSFQLLHSAMLCECIKCLIYKSQAVFKHVYYRTPPHPRYRGPQSESLPPKKVPFNSSFAKSRYQESWATKLKIWKCWRILIKVCYARPISEYIHITAPVKRLWNNYIWPSHTNIELEFHDPIDPCMDFRQRLGLKPIFEKWYSAWWISSLQHTSERS